MARRYSYQDGRSAVRAAGAYEMPGPGGRGRATVRLMTWDGAPVGLCAVVVGGCARVVKLDYQTWGAAPVTRPARLTPEDLARLSPLPSASPVRAGALLWAARAVPAGRFAA